MLGVIPDEQAVIARPVYKEVRRFKNRQQRTRMKGLRVL